MQEDGTSVTVEVEGDVAPAVVEAAAEAAAEAAEEVVKEEAAAEKAAEEAFFKMDNVLIDDRRIHVDFSQSMHHLWRQFKARILSSNSPLYQDPVRYVFFFVSHQDQ